MMWEREHILAGVASGFQGLRSFAASAPITGQSSDSDGGSSDAESEDAQEDKQGLFRLLDKELSRSLDQTKLEDLSCQQLAYTLSGLTKYVVAADILQVGGESEPCSE